MQDSGINSAEKATLRQAVALLKRCRLFVGNDSGPMHIAAAVGLPAVEISCHPIDGSLFHSNSPRRFGPWGVSHVILQPKNKLDFCTDACNASHAHCIRGVTVEQTKEAITSLLYSYNVLRSSTAIA